MWPCRCSWRCMLLHPVSSQQSQQHGRVVLRKFSLASCPGVQSCKSSAGARGVVRRTGLSVQSRLCLPQDNNVRCAMKTTDTTNSSERICVHCPAMHLTIVTSLVPAVPWSVGQTHVASSLARKRCKDRHLLAAPSATHTSCATRLRLLGASSCIPPRHATETTEAKAPASLSRQPGMRLVVHCRRW